MKFKRRLRIEKGIIDLTPLMNVFFLLLIFFVFTSSFIFQPGIKVHLPRALTSEVIQQDSVTLTITAAEKIYINDREVVPDDLASHLRILGKEDTALLIKADQKAPLGKVVEIWDLCRKEGITQVNIATNQ